MVAATISVPRRSAKPKPCWRPLPLFIVVGRWNNRVMARTMGRNQVISQLTSALFQCFCVDPKWIKTRILFGKKPTRMTRKALEWRKPPRFFIVRGSAHIIKKNYSLSGGKPGPGEDTHRSCPLQSVGFPPVNKATRRRFFRIRQWGPYRWRPKGTLRGGYPWALW